MTGQRWEYRTLKLDVAGLFGPKVDETKLEAGLNALGEDGWELVVGFDTNQYQGISRHVVLMFKRPAA